MATIERHIERHEAARRGDFKAYFRMLREDLLLDEEGRIMDSTVGANPYDFN